MQLPVGGTGKGEGIAEGSPFQHFFSTCSRTFGVALR